MFVDDTTIEMVLTSLLSGLIVALLAAMLSLRYAGKKLYEILLSRERTTYLFFIVQILLIPVALSLLRGTRLSSIVLAAYLRQLVISVVVVASFYASWKLFGSARMVAWKLFGSSRAIAWVAASRLLAAEPFIIASVYRVAGTIKQLVYAIVPRLLALEEKRLADVVGEEQRLRKQLTNIP